ncbi:MAG: hypothetical protein NC305_04000 [Lachnospiraceae bacterium]|nr:hypothetical protein [Muribaculaceae bacterium]MCM1409694.1 hypothetical protein [Lachnospiraceae bacterium]
MVNDLIVYLFDGLDLPGYPSDLVLLVAALVALVLLQVVVDIFLIFVRWLFHVR